MPLPADTLWIDDPAALRARLSAATARIGLDTEFIRERTYWPHLALVQIALERRAAPPLILLVDAQRPGMVDGLRALLADPSILKVMHSASEDLVALQHACGELPAPLFDTQIAAALAGIGTGLSYQRLLADVLGVWVDKGQTRSDWTRRPLSQAQLQYAAEDVRHLLALHDALSERLQLLDRMPWLVQDCARQLSNDRSEGEHWPHLSVRGAQGLHRDGQVRLLRLLRWRDAHAREYDRPRNWILDNGLALQLAANPPQNQAALQQQLEAQPKSPRKLAAAIWTALISPLPDEANMPLAAPDGHDKSILKRLQHAVAARSAELGLPDGVLATRRSLLALMEQQMEQGQWPDLLSGWRQDELEPRLRPLLARAAISGGSTGQGRHDRDA